MVNSIFVIIGTIIGAGFASGKEIFTFFNVYGIYGLFGLIISEIIMGLAIYKIFRLIIHYNITSYSQFIDKIITKSKFMNLVICNIITIFLLISFIIMIAGFAAYFVQELNFPYIIGAILIATLCFFTFLKDIDGIVKVNKYFIPFLIFIILLLGIKNSNAFAYFTYHTSTSNFNWLISSLLYASYNLIIATPILIGLKKYIDNINSVKYVTILSIFFLLLMGVILFNVLNYYFIDIAHVELPTIYIASNLGGLFKYICGFVILGAIFTTAISSGYGFLSNLNISNRKIYIFTAFIVCLMAVILSNIGFSNLLSFLYPILGMLRIDSNRFYIFF